MSLDMSCLNGSTVSIDESLLFELPRQLGVDAPAWRRLANECNDDPEVDAGAVVAFAAEVRALRDRWAARQREELVRTHQVTAKDPDVRARLADELAAARPDATRRTLEALLVLCEQALAGGVGLGCVSD